MVFLHTSLYYAHKHDEVRYDLIMDTALIIRVRLAVSCGELVHNLLNSETALYRIGREIFESKDRKMVTDICSVYTKGDNTTNVRTSAIVASSALKFVKSIDTRLKKSKVHDSDSLSEIQDALDDIVELSNQLRLVCRLS